MTTFILTFWLFNKLIFFSSLPPWLSLEPDREKFVGEIEWDELILTAVVESGKTKGS